MNWIHKFWSHIGGIIAVGIILAIAIRGKPYFNFDSLLWLHFAILLLHQFEEYSFPGKFKEFYNTNLLNKNSITKYPLNDQGILLVNVIFAWTFYLIAAIMGAKTIYLTIGLAGVTLLNGLMHTMMFFKLKKYNPGLLTSLLLFIPFGVFLLRHIYQLGIADIKSWVMGLAIFMVGTALIPLSIKLTNKVTVPTIGKK